MAAVTRLGADLAGTAKKIPSFPFTFGKVPVRNQVLIPEDGAKSVFWTKSDANFDGNQQENYALAYRSGLGRVVLAQTTLEIVGPGRWAFVSHKSVDKAP